MTVDSDKFISDSMESNDGKMSAEHAAQLLDSLLTGDTIEAPTMPPMDSSETPTTTDAEEAEAGPVKDSDPATVAPTETAEDAEQVVLARDGKHTIPYQTLLDAREQAQQAMEDARIAREELERVRLQVQTPSNTESTQHEKQLDTAQAAIDAGYDPEIFGDFSEEALVDGINKLVAMRSNEIEQRVQEAIAKAMAPIEQQKQEDIATAHNRTIYEAHSDADSIVQSSEFDAWRAAQPSYVQTAFNQVLQQGTAAEVVELLDNFKQATASEQAPAGAPRATEDAKAKAKAVIGSVAPAVPASLSDIAGGHKGTTDIGERMQNMSATDMMETMAKWTPEQINQYLNTQT